MTFFDPWIALILLFALIIGFGFYVLFHKKKRFSQKDIVAFRKHWKELENIAEHHPDQAVLKADKLLDHALYKAGYSGTMGEKLKKSRAVFRDNNGIWSAHKLRNRIAHEIDIKVSNAQAKAALQSFKKAFFDLGVSL